MKSSAELQQTLAQAHQRLYPSIRDPNYLVLSKRREIFRQWIQKMDGHELMVLDIGGRLPTYRPLLNGRVAKYFALDLAATPVVNVRARGEQLPVASGTVDLILCTQVLQYVPRLEPIFSEMFRVLKPGGAAMLSVPAAQARDTEEEYWRFSPASIRMLAASFAEVEIVSEGTSISGFFRTLNVYMSIFAKYRIVRWLFSITLYPASNLAALFLEKLVGSRNDQFTANYSAIARKAKA